MRDGYSSRIATIQIQVLKLLKTANARTAVPAQGAPHLHALLSVAESCAVKRALAESVADKRGYFVATSVRLFAEAGWAPKTQLQIVRKSSIAFASTRMHTHQFVTPGGCGFVKAITCRNLQTHLASGRRCMYLHRTASIHPRLNTSCPRGDDCYTPRLLLLRPPSTRIRAEALPLTL